VTCWDGLAAAGVGAGLGGAGRYNPWCFSPIISDCPRKMKTPVSLLCAFVLATVAVFSVQAEALKGDVQAGERKNTMCMGCHGIVGYQATFPEVHKVPKIAGQNEQYIVNALVAYKKGERKHPSMRGIATTLTDQDIADVAAYYAQLGVVAGAAALPKAPAGSTKAAELVAKGACTSCHGESLNQPVDPGFPKLAGQYRDYLFVALKSYKAEGNPNVGRGNAVMGGVAKQFSHAELKVLAEYLASLQGDVKTVPENRLR